jgi:hypothetical protein
MALTASRHLRPVPAALPPIRFAAVRFAAVRLAAVRLATIRLVAAALTVGLCARSARATSAGPVEASARGVEFRSHDEETGALRAHLVAESASMKGTLAELEGARLVRYDGEGRPVLEVRAARGSYAGGRGARLLGGVEIAWELRPQAGGGTTSLVCEDVEWDEGSDTLTTGATVRGRLLSGRRGGDEILNFTGRGFVCATADRRGEILRDAVVHAKAAGAAGWRATADRGIVFTGARDGAVVLELRGPVTTESGGSAARADALRLLFEEHKQGEQGELELREGSFRGTVRALVRGGDGADARASSDAGLLPGGFVVRLFDASGQAPAERGIELRAAVMTVNRAAGEVVLHGTATDPARVTFEGGELRGTRIDLRRESVVTDGGAPSEFTWGGRE